MKLAILGGIMSLAITMTLATTVQATVASGAREPAGAGQEVAKGDVVEPELEEVEVNGDAEEVVDIGPAEPPTRKKAARAEPIVTGAGRVRSLNPIAQAGVPGVSSSAAADWTNVGRNDPCPCGSGKKFKKCHGMNQ